MTDTHATPEPIPFLDLRLQEADIDAVASVLRSGWLTAGPRTAEFEERFASQLGVAHAVALSSCTAALHLAYLAAGVGPGDEVILPSYTFVATASAVVQCGGRPVFADILGEHDLSIDPADVERLITPRTRAVCAVHFAGYPAPLERLDELCSTHGLQLIEDAAHAPSATHRARKLGTWGLAGAFSLFSNKILSVGEGGVLVSDDERVIELARRLRSHGLTAGSWNGAGKTDLYDVSAPGFNYRIDEPRGALALSRLPRMESDIARRRELTLRYRERLAAVPGLTLPYSDQAVAESSAYVMPVLIEDARRREPIRQRMRDLHGVQTSVLYSPVHRFTAYRRIGARRLEQTEQVSAREITLPLYPHLGERAQDRVIGALEAELQR